MKGLVGLVASMNGWVGDLGGEWSNRWFVMAGTVLIDSSQCRGRMMGSMMVYDGQRLFTVVNDGYDMIHSCRLARYFVHKVNLGNKKHFLSPYFSHGSTGTKNTTPGHKRHSL